MQSIHQSNTFSIFSVSNLPTAVAAHFLCSLLLLGISRLALGESEIQRHHTPTNDEIHIHMYVLRGGTNYAAHHSKVNRTGAQEQEQCQDSRTDNQPKSRTRNKRTKESTFHSPGRRSNWNQREIYVFSDSNGLASGVWSIHALGILILSWNK